MKILVVTVLTLIAMSSATTSVSGRTYAACSGSDEVELLYKPRGCYFGFGLSYQNANLIKMRWSTWGASAARGKGLVTASMGAPPIAIAVRLSRPKYCPNPDVTIFSRVGTKTRYGSSRDGVKMARCADLGAYAAVTGAVKRCGDAGTLYGGEVRLTNVTSRNVSCSRARRFVRGFEIVGGPSCGEDFYCTFRGYQCRNDGRSGTYIDHRCERPSPSRTYVVRWQTK